MWDYNEIVMDLFLHPRNIGEVENADGVGEVGNVSCGDALKLSFKLDKDGKISEAKFKTFGCASAIASSSALTELLIGKTLEEAEKITNKDIVAELGELPEEMRHCSVLGMEALQAAIADYRGEKVADGEDEHEGGSVGDDSLSGGGRSFLPLHLRDGEGESLLPSSDGMWVWRRGRT